MEIRSTLTNSLGEVLDVVYRESNPTENLDGIVLQAVHACCFYNGKLVIIYSQRKGRWSLPGGSIEPGESIEDAVMREVQEESNMKVLYQDFIGYQDVYEPGRPYRQTRSFCIVEPYGDFVEDPDDGEVTEMKLIDPKDYKQYFDWGKVGDHVMEQALKKLTSYIQN